jgi:hypothetical protein
VHTNTQGGTLTHTHTHTHTHTLTHTRTHARTHAPRSSEGRGPCSWFSCSHKVSRDGRPRSVSPKAPYSKRLLLRHRCRRRASPAAIILTRVPYVSINQSPLVHLLNLPSSKV